MQPKFKAVRVLDLLLNRDNPRHVSKQNQQEVIEYLIEGEEVYNLARHMSQNGINPLEVVAVFADSEKNLIVAEGNRRVCAAQLLTDPDKAPEKQRKRYKTLAQKSVDVSVVNIAQFENYEAAQPWLQVLHDGEQDGVGRRRWKPDQKARATTNKSNDALAVALLDYAEEKGIISAETRPNIQVSTATRYLANPAVRRAMGITSVATSNDVQIEIDVETFEKILLDFFNGILSKQLHSRSVTLEWHNYAQTVQEKFRTTSVHDVESSETKTASLTRTENVAQTSERSQMSAPTSQPLQSKRQRAARVQIVTPETRFIARSGQLIEALNKIGSFKLSSLYHSITSVRLDEHPALLTTGAWVFIENITALHGRNPASDFVSYIGNLMTHWGIEREQKKDYRLSLDYISQNGNAQKHSAKFTAIDARNLNNHFHVLDEILVKIADECAATIQNKQ